MLVKEPTHELLQRLLPGDYAITEDFAGRRSVLDSGRAQRELGFAPKFTWDKVLHPESA